MIKSLSDNVIDFAEIDTAYLPSKLRISLVSVNWNKYREKHEKVKKRNEYVFNKF